MAGQENQQYTVLYGRLSQEDERAGESNSIQHQRTLLEKYAKEKGFENTIFLADDGYSGTNFERPSWKKIVEMIEAGQVANLIVKDASRLGREYLQVGYYMEIYFPILFHPNPPIVCCCFPCAACSSNFSFTARAAPAAKPIAAPKFSAAIFASMRRRFSSASSSSSINVPTTASPATAGIRGTGRGSPPRHTNPPVPPCQGSAPA